MASWFHTKTKHHSNPLPISKVNDMCVYNAIMREIQSLMNENTASELDNSYYRMRCAEIHGAINVCAAELSVKELEDIDAEFLKLCKKCNTDPIFIRNTFYQYDW